MCGAVSNRIARRTGLGWSWASCCAIIPPREKPTTSICFNGRARQNAKICRVISRTVLGVSPLELATPTFVEHDDITIEGEAVGHEGIPVVHAGVKILKENKRESSTLAEATSCSTGTAPAARRWTMECSAAEPVYKGPLTDHPENGVVKVVRSGVWLNYRDMIWKPCGRTES